MIIRSLRLSAFDSCNQQSTNTLHMCVGASLHSTDAHMPAFNIPTSYQRSRTRREGTLARALWMT